MMLDWSKVRVFVKPGPTDMRKQINGLSILVTEELGMDPLDGSLFLFCNKQRPILKVIYWDRNGFCLWLLCEGSQKSPNWLFSSSPRGAHASPTLYSLIETAKANGIEPYRYLRYLLTKLALVQAQDDYRRLTPQHLDPWDFEAVSV
jgi:hypothetical protein